MFQRPIHESVLDAVMCHQPRFTLSRRLVVLAARGAGGETSLTFLWNWSQLKRVNFFKIMLLPGVADIQSRINSWPFNFKWEQWWRTVLAPEPPVGLAIQPLASLCSSTSPLLTWVPSSLFCRDWFQGSTFSECLVHWTSSQLWLLSGKLNLWQL